MLLGVQWTSVVSLIISLIALVMTVWDHVENLIKRQANMISAWQSEQDVGHQFALVNNASNELIRNVVIAYGIPNKGYPIMKPGSDIRHSAFVQTIPPGRFGVFLSPDGLAGMAARPEVEIAFTDIKGRSWIRDAAGKLHRIWPTKPFSILGGKLHINHGSPQEYMGITRPEIPARLWSTDVKFPVDKK